MSVLHTLLEKLHLARHNTDVVDPEAVARAIEDKFKQTVADEIKRLDAEAEATWRVYADRLSALEARFAEHEQAKAKDAHEVAPPAPTPMGDAKTEPAKPEHADGTDEHSDHQPEGHGG